MLASTYRFTLDCSLFLFLPFSPPAPNPFIGSTPILCPCCYHRSSSSFLFPFFFRPWPRMLLITSHPPTGQTTIHPFYGNTHDFFFPATKSICAHMCVSVGPPPPLPISELGSKNMQVNALRATQFRGIVSLVTRVRVAADSGPLHVSVPATMIQNVCDLTLTSPCRPS